jgi:predicted metal-dependent hydrolase
LLNDKQLKIQVKKQLEQYFIAQAQLYIPTRLNILSELVDLFPVSYKIRQYKSRWGSCNNRQELSFNYLLMMSPDWVVDYVIIHELCHLKHLNHSADFWLLVEKFSPEFKLAKRWLHDRQIELQWC